MARIEADREDLFCELTTYVPRWEVLLRSTGEVIVVALRLADRWSIYRASGDYFQFTSTGQLRRAFAGDQTLLSTGTTLSTMHKQRSSTQTTLVRRDFTSEECEHFVSSMRTYLAGLSESLQSGEFDILRCEPAGADIVTDALPRLQFALQADPPLSSAVTRF